MITEKAHAKINIALEVMETIGGYHQVNNLMIPIDIYDVLYLEKADSISIDNDPFPGENIITKAANAFFEYTKINGGCHFKLKKNIPHAAGLAGGSTDAAAALRGLNTLYDTKLSVKELEQIGASLGSDVPFFITEKPALCTGRGEIIHPVVSNLSPLKILLVKPVSGLSTALVYKNYQYNGKRKQEKLDNLLKALKENNKELLKENIFNDLGDTALSLNEEMKNIYMKMSLIGLKVYVSGSGPTMYVLDYKEDEADIVKEMVEYEVYVKECSSL